MSEPPEIIYKCPICGGPASSNGQWLPDAWCSHCESWCVTADGTPPGCVMTPEEEEKILGMINRYFGITPNNEET